MTEAILTALIAGGAAVFGSLLSALGSGRLLTYRLDALKEDFADLRERVNRHNNLVERMTAAEQSLKSAHKRIDELKGRNGI